MHDPLLRQGILGQRGTSYRPIHESDELEKENFHDTRGRIKVVS